MVKEPISRKDEKEGKNGETVTAKAKKEKRQDTLQTKVVVRHLPPTMTEELFVEQVSPIPDHNFLYFAKADLSLGSYAFSRAYINFTHQEDIFIFKDKFDGYVFVDVKGNEYPAIVEFAPYQKIPRRRVGINGFPISADKRDAKSGTIEQDSEYLKFLESLQQSKNEANLPSAEVYLEEIEARDKELKANHGCPKVTTPLIEYLKQKKAEKMRLREERREERKRLQELRRQRDEEKRREKERFQNMKIKEKVKDKDKEKEKANEKERDKNKREKGKDSTEKKEMEKENEKVKREKNKMKVETSLKKLSNKEKHDEDKSTDLPTFTVRVYQNSDRSKSNDKTKPVIEELDSSFGEQETTMVSESKSAKVTEGSKLDSKSEDHRVSDGKKVRNKDRPALEIYRPRRFPVSNSNETKDRYESSGGSQRENHRFEQKSDRSVRNTKVFTRSKHAD